MPWPILLAALFVTAPGQTRSAGYDPARDPARDLEVVVKQAQQEGKRILLVIGGEWCSWCHALEAYLKDNEDVRTEWAKHFVTLKVNFSPENQNRSFLGRYPLIPGYPHIFVLESDGRFLHSQGTAELESGRSYSKEKMMQFIDRWRIRRADGGHEWIVNQLRDALKR